MNKIKFPAGASSVFFNSLNEEVERMFAQTGLLKRRRRLLWVKMVFYFGIHISAYAMLFLFHPLGTVWLATNYIFIGLSGMLLAFNVSHDACHGTFSKNKSVNYWLYHLSFNMQGTNAYLWKIRHIASHHVFPNVNSQLRHLWKRTCHLRGRNSAVSYP
jgi:linoleoyl-CoA desaturase